MILITVTTAGKNFRNILLIGKFARNVLANVGMVCAIAGVKFATTEAIWT